MGHTFTYLTCDKKSEILTECADYAWRNVDREENYSGSYHGNMTIRDSYPICKDYDDAVAAIEKMAEGTFYHDFAVRFYDTDKVKKTKKIEQLEKRLQEMRVKAAEYENAHSVKTHTSLQIGCRTCGSKLTISYLKSEQCPVCGKDLRAAYITERLEKFIVDQRNLSNEIVKEKRKLNDKAPVRWCFKVEVHN